jgi:hypothetical protein
MTGLHFAPIGDLSWSFHLVSHLTVTITEYTAGFQVAGSS